MGNATVRNQTDGVARVGSVDVGDATVIVSATEPVNPTEGVLWLDTSTSAVTGTRTLRTVTANHTALTTDDIILCDAIGGSFTVTLPTAVGNVGKQFDIKKIDVSGNVVTVQGAQPIDGSTNKLLALQYDEITIVSDNVVWWII